MYVLKQIPIILILLLSISCSLFAKPVNMVYLIPEGFTGGVIIYYDEINGVEPEILKDGTVLYRIPKDGFLKVKPITSSGPYELSYFYFDEKDNRKEIEYLGSQNAGNKNHPKPRNQDEVTNDERDNGIFAMNHRKIRFSLSKQANFVYAFSVGHPKDSTSIYVDIDWRMDEIKKSINDSKRLQEK